MARALRCVVLALALALPAAAETALEALVVAPDERVAGQPLSDQVNQWWQWAFSMPDSESSIVDTDGTFCGTGQSGAVWYLAGGYGSAKIERSCAIPAGRHLFFPIINLVQMEYPATEADCAGIRDQASRNNDTFVYLKVFLDGAALERPERFRIASESCFDPYARTPVIAGAPQNALAATDGYWIMLRPLPPGPHRLEFRAFYTNPDEAYGDMVQNIAYDLTVQAE